MIFLFYPFFVECEWNVLQFPVSFCQPCQLTATTFFLYRQNAFFFFFFKNRGDFFFHCECYFGKPPTSIKCDEFICTLRLIFRTMKPSKLVTISIYKKICIQIWLDAKVKEKLMETVKFNYIILPCEYLPLRAHALASLKKKERNKILSFLLATHWTIETS